MPNRKASPQQNFRSLLRAEEATPARYLESRRQANALVAALDEDDVKILQQIVAGWSSPQIAAYLDLDVHEFETRRTALFTRLNAGSTSEAVRIGIYAGLE